LLLVISSIEDLDFDQNQEGEALQRSWKSSERGHNTIGQNAVRSKHLNTQVGVFDGIAITYRMTIATVISGLMIAS
jgi:hypothetical protein